MQSQEFPAILKTSKALRLLIPVNSPKFYEDFQKIG